MFDSIFKKIITIFIAILIFSFSVTGVILYYSLGDYVKSDAKRELDHSVRTIATFINSYYIAKNNGDLINASSMENSFNNFVKTICTTSDAMVLIVDKDGIINQFEQDVKLNQSDIDSIKQKLNIYNYRQGKLNNKRQYQDLINGKIEKFEDDKDFYGLYKNISVNNWVTIGKPFYIEPNGASEIGGAVYVSKPLPYVTKTREEIIKLFIYAVLISTLIAIILIYAFSINLTRPIKQMNKAVKVISSGNFKDQLKIESNDEVGELAMNFNNMVAALNKLEEMRSGFIANVSHELRTPVTSIKGFVEGILDGTISKDRQNEYLLIVKDETVRLSRLVNNLLNLAKIESGSINLSPTSFDINELIRRTIIKFENLIIEKDLNIEADFEHDYIFVKADKDSIEQVVINLFHNAVKFTEEKGSIKLSTSIKKNKVYVTIEDTGIGIGEEELKRIWERFYKTDKSRSKDKIGAGLGLSIVKNIINENNGEIWAESKLNEGTKFIFVLDKSSNNSKPDQRKLTS